jgi:hypothetical protein
MSNRFWIFFVLLFFGVMVLGLKSLTNWGRRYVYTGGEIKIDNPGLGKKFSRYPDMYSMVDKSNGTEKLVTVEEINNYDRNLYDIVFLPSHSSLDYSVGYFVGWEGIDNSTDKYLILQDDRELSTKYRVAFNNSRVFSTEIWGVTDLAVENVVSSLYNSKSSVSGEKIVLSDIGFEKLFKIIKNSDVLIVSVSDYGKHKNIVDASGNYVARKLFVRRFFGINELKGELWWL